MTKENTFKVRWEQPILRELMRLAVQNRASASELARRVLEEYMREHLDADICIALGLVSPVHIAPTHPPVKSTQMVVEISLIDESVHQYAKTVSVPPMTSATQPRRRVVADDCRG